MKYKGSCHCGQVAFEIEGELTQVTECNCSICSRKGALLWGVSPERFRLITAQESMATYTFGEQTIKHRFCPKCGIHAFAEGILSGTPMVVVNARCLEDVELSSLPVKHFDGRSL
ncbi:MAG: GFA family protein [Hydrogenophilales bacterium]|nr:GFA family protein [Hydrogenophilales bacterium]